MTDPRDRKTYIYRLLDPRDRAVKYIGKTVNLTWRGKCHRSPQGESHCARWLRGLKQKGLKAILEVIETVEAGSDWTGRERYWISYYKESGAALCNMSAGGESWFGPRLSKETKEKLRQKFLGRPIPLEQRAQISKSLTGKKQSPETVAKRKATIIARYGNQGCYGDAHRKAVSEGLKGRVISPETREKLRQANLGKKQSAETIAKRITPEFCEKARVARLKYLESQKPKWTTPTFEVISAA